MSLQTYSVVVATFAAIVAFIALAWQIISKIQENDVKLKVYQRGSDIVTRATWWDEGVVYVILEAVIINASPKATAVVTRYEIALPWKDEFFDLLPEPEGGRGYPFSPESAIVSRRCPQPPHPRAGSIAAATARHVRHAHWPRNGTHTC